MESRNITLTLDKAKEWYEKGGELKEVALQAYKEEELTKNELPKTWEEFCLRYPIKTEERCINTCSRMSLTRIGSRDSVVDRNIMPSEKAAEAHLALIQLHQLRDCYRQGWVPDWNSIDEKFAIRFVKNNFTIEMFIHISNFFSFPTEELAKEFLTNFRDLFEQAKYLIY